MFLRLIASQPRSPERWHTRGGLVAVLGHAALVTGALLGTLRPTDPPTAIPAVLMPWPQPSEQPRGGVPAAPLLGDPVVVPVDVPPGLPLIEGPRPFDSTQWLRGSRDDAAAAPFTPDVARPWVSTVVEEPPRAARRARPAVSRIVARRRYRRARRGGGGDRHAR